MIKVKTPTVKIVNQTDTNFEVFFADPDKNNGKVVLRGAPPTSDTDLIRMMVAYHTEVGGNVKLYRFIECVLCAHDDVLIRDRHWTHSEIKNAFEGKADDPLPVLPEVKTKLAPAALVKYDGFERFNGGPHLCVDVPDGLFTITCKMSNGKKVTFAFVPYKDGAPASCVDIQHQTTGLTIENGHTDVPVQEVIVWGLGKDICRTHLLDEKPSTLLTLLLANVEEAAERDKKKA